MVMWQGREGGRIVRWDGWMFLVLFKSGGYLFLMLIKVKNRWVRFKIFFQCEGSLSRNLTAREPPWKQNELPPMVNILYDISCK